MTPREAVALMMQLRSEAHSNTPTRAQLNAAMRQVIASEPKLDAGLESMLNEHGDVDWDALGTTFPPEAHGVDMPTRARYAEATRIVVEHLDRIDGLVASMQWDPQRGPVIADLDLSVGELMLGLAAALDDEATPYAPVRHPR